MAPNPELRASDADRDRVAAALREHMAQGRLTMDELNDRISQAYEARTFGELQQLTADLPEHDLYQLPIPVGRQSRPARPEHRGVQAYRRTMAAAWGTWAAVNLLCAIIWVLTMVGNVEWIYPWPLWVAGPWGAVLLVATVFGPKPPEDRTR